MSLLAAPAMAASGATGHDKIPSAVPSTISPAVNDGQVNGIVQVGTTMVIGGTFTKVTPPGGAVTARSRVASFDAATGKLRAFNPVLNGDVQDVLAGPTADTVYVAGSFTTVSGVATSHVALLNVITGAPVAGFKATPTNGAVNSITMAGTRLLLGGNFTTAGGAAHQGLASISQTTGVIDSFMGINLTEHHNSGAGAAQGAVGVKDMEATPSGTKLAVVGNFRKANGIDRDQVVVINLTGATAAVDLTWRTHRYEDACFSWAFDSYMRGVAVSPDGTYFVVAATGGQNTGSLCDAAVRFDFGASGDNVQPTWVDYAGGDTLWSVEITEQAVYVGGHQRWMNNSNGSDYAGEGAVPRPGLVALDIESGLPLAWNPGRLPRGAAAFSIYASPTGLWVGSDTEYIGNYKYKRPRLAYFPLAGGSQQPSDQAPTLPGNVYLGGPPSTVSQGNVLYRVNAGGDAVGSTDNGPTWTSDSNGSSSYHNGGNNAAGYGGGATVDSTVPASTPSAVFNSELWSPSDTPPMSWSFPATNALPLQVRLFFANRCGCTATAGQRKFDVSVDGNQVLNDFDIVATVGPNVGTMRAFDITSDGIVNIDFSHVVENPLINAIEIVRRDLPPPTGAPSTLSSIAFDGTTASGPTSADARGIAWNNVRGAFLLGSTLYYGKVDGYLYKRTYTTSTTGPETRIDPYNDPLWNDAKDGVGGTERGAVPDLYGQLPNLTGVFYANDRVYYTLSGDSHLYWRWFNVDSGIVGSQVFTADGSVSWADTAGLFKSGNTLYVVSKATGFLSKVSFTGGAPSGVPVPADSGRDWRARAVFIGPGAAPANTPPTAAFTTSCSQRTCTVNGSGSHDSDGSVASYAWTYGDGGTDSGVAPVAHTYGADGTFTITLTVTDNGGATGSTTHDVAVLATPPPASNVSFVGQNQVSVQSAKPQVTIPGNVVAGDQLILVGSYGITSPTPVTPAGWTLSSSKVASGLESFVWTKQVVAGDAGQAVATQLAATAKSTLTLAAYRGVAATGGVTAASTSDSSTAQHTSPTIAVPGGGWVVQLWTDKSSTTTAWTPPSGVTVRGTSYGTASGRTSGLLADSGGPVAPGTYGGAVAVTDAPSAKGIAWTFALKSS